MSFDCYNDVCFKAFYKLFTSSGGMFFKGTMDGFLIKNSLSIYCDCKICFEIDYIS